MSGGPADERFQRREGQGYHRERRRLRRRQSKRGKRGHGAARGFPLGRRVSPTLAFYFFSGGAAGAGAGAVGGSVGAFTASFRMRAICHMKLAPPAAFRPHSLAAAIPRNFFAWS